MTRRDKQVALVVAGCFFMELLDGTIVTTAAPAIGASLGVPSASISLVVTAYVVTLAALIPLSGWMAARWGGRRIFLIAIATFTIASIACAMSPTLGCLVAARVLQGAGGAMMVPVGRLVVLAKTDKADLMKAASYIIWPGLVGPIVAPLLGGALTTYASWHWIFLVNVPLGVVAFLLAWRLIEAPRQAAPPPLDSAGFAFTCGGLLGFSYTAHLLAEPLDSWLPVVALGTASAVLLILGARHLVRFPRPLVNLRTLRLRTFGLAIGGGTLFFVVVGAGPFLFPLLFQEAFGWSPVKSGAVVLALFFGNIGVKPLTNALYRRIGFRAVIVASSLALGGTMVASILLTARTPLALVIVVVAASGIARSIGGTGYVTIAFSEVPADQLGDANVLQATTQQLALGFGVALAAIGLRLGKPLGRIVADGGSSTITYAVAFGLMAVVAMLSAVLALRMRPGAGDSLR